MLPAPLGFWPRQLLQQPLSPRWLSTNYVQLLRRNIRSQVKQLIAENLKLSETEAARFWRVYDRYMADLAKINDQRYALIKEYAEHYPLQAERGVSAARVQYIAAGELIRGKGYANNFAA